jgi:hypothetical protein
MNMNDYECDWKVVQSSSGPCPGAAAGGGGGCYWDLSYLVAAFVEIWKGKPWFHKQKHINTLQGPFLGLWRGEPWFQSSEAFSLN